MTLQEIIDDVKADGIAIGREQGIILGEERGALQTRIETVRSAFQMKLPYEQISLLTGLSIDQIADIADEMNL